MPKVELDKLRKGTLGKSEKECWYFNITLDDTLLIGFRSFDGKIYPPATQMGKKGTWVQLVKVSAAVAEEIYRLLSEENIPLLDPDDALKTL